MDIGLSAYGMTAPDLLAMASAADQLGFASLWVGEHLVLPVRYESPHPTDHQVGQPHRERPVVDLDTPLVDPLVALAAVAASTDRLELGTAIYILALRHPLLTARAVSTLHDISGGRFLLGVGTGWLAEEFEAFGVPFPERVKRFDEGMELLRDAWRGGPLDHDGQWFPTHGPVQVVPEPCPVPIVFGGNTERAFERAARWADGWFASGTPTLEEFLRMRDRIESLRTKFGRAGPFRYPVRATSWEPDVLDQYAAEGVEEALVWARSPYLVSGENDIWPVGPVAESTERLTDVARSLGLC
jgi:probable F420-dependent oxidoreductase